MGVCPQRHSNSSPGNLNVCQNISRWYNKAKIHFQDHPGICPCAINTLNKIINFLFSAQPNISSWPFPTQFIVVSLFNVFYSFIFFIAFMLLGCKNSRPSFLWLKIWTKANWSNTQIMYLGYIWNNTENKSEWILRFKFHSLLLLLLSIQKIKLDFHKQGKNKKNNLWSQWWSTHCANLTDSINKVEWSWRVKQDGPRLMRRTSLRVCE